VNFRTILGFHTDGLNTEVRLVGGGKNRATGAQPPRAPFTLITTTKQKTKTDFSLEEMAAGVIS